MKHGLLIVLIIALVVIGIFLPFIEGDYDYSAVVLSQTFQFGSFVSLLLVPVGILGLILKNRRVLIGKIAFVVFVLILLAAALGSFAANSRFSAIAILIVSAFILFRIRKKSYDNNAFSYLIFIPLAVIVIREGFFEKIKANRTEFVIKKSEELIRDIESYKNTNGHYPLSLLSTIEDYKPMISGVPRFHYELNGEAYNLYFEQFSDMLGTEEIVMYNKLDEHEMTVHNQDLLRIPEGSIIRGYHKFVELPGHWKIFYFD